MVFRISVFFAEMSKAKQTEKQSRLKAEQSESRAEQSRLE
jgi:hypothetical protein